MSQPQETAAYVLDAVRSLADEMRQARPSAGWRIVFPPWIVAQAGGWDAFVVQFEASHERTGLHHAGVIGFEISETCQWLSSGAVVQIPGQQHTMARYLRDKKEDE